MILRAADSLVRMLGQAALAVATFAVIVIMLVAATDVIGSQFFGRSVPSSLEIQESFEVLVIFGALAAVQQRRAHIVIDILVGRLGPMAKRSCDVFALICSCVLFSLLTWQAWLLAARSVRVSEMSPGFVTFPLWPFKVLFCAGCAFALLEFLRHLAWALAGREAPSGGAHEQQA